MRHLILMTILALATISAHADTQTVLNPGNGRDYLIYWCGGQTINEYAAGYDESGNAKTVVVVQTRCNGSGRGSRNRYHKTCTEVMFDLSGAIISKGPNHYVTWLMGNPAPSCGVSYSAAGVYENDDSEGNFLSLLYTTSIRTSLRAVVEAP